MSYIYYLINLQIIYEVLRHLKQLLYENIQSEYVYICKEIQRR